MFILLNILILYHNSPRRRKIIILFKILLIGKWILINIKTIRIFIQFSSIHISQIIRRSTQIYLWAKLMFGTAIDLMLELLLVCKVSLIFSLMICLASIL